MAASATASVGEARLPVSMVTVAPGGSGAVATVVGAVVAAVVPVGLGVGAATGERANSGTASSASSATPSSTSSTGGNARRDEGRGTWDINRVTFLVEGA